MIGRSFATEDAHDKIHAYVIDLFEVIECESETSLEQVRCSTIVSVNPLRCCSVNTKR